MPLIPGSILQIFEMTIWMVLMPVCWCGNRWLSNSIDTHISNDQTFEMPCLLFSSMHCSCVHVSTTCVMHCRKVSKARKIQLSIFGQSKIACQIVFYRILSTAKKSSALDVSVSKYLPNGNGEWHQSWANRMSIGFWASSICQFSDAKWYNWNLTTPLHINLSPKRNGNYYSKYALA